MAIQSYMVKSSTRIFRDQLKHEWKKLTVVTLPTISAFVKQVVNEHSRLKLDLPDCLYLACSGVVLIYLRLFWFKCFDVF